MPVTERFVTKIKPTRVGTTVCVGKGTLTFPEGVALTLGEEVFRSHNNNAITAYFIDFTFDADTETTVSFRME